jgi:hypothetical protein
MSFLGRFSQGACVATYFERDAANDQSVAKGGEFKKDMEHARFGAGADVLKRSWLGEGDVQRLGAHDGLSNRSQDCRSMPIRAGAGEKGGENRALIVFADAPDKWALRWLPAGFRHCFAVIATRESGQWIYLNPASHQLQCELWQFSALFDPAAYYREQGHNCLWVTLPDEGAQTVRLGMFSCVEVMKRLLGISAWYVLTPAGLHRYLVNKSKIYQKSS